MEEHVLIVKAATNGTEGGAQTGGPGVPKREVMNAVNPSELMIGIKRVKELRNRGILIETTTKQELDLIKDKLGESPLAEEHAISVPDKRNPNIIVFGVAEEIEESQLLEHIVKQNVGIGDGDLDVKYSTTPKNSRRNWILGVRSGAYQSIMVRERLNIGWERLRFTG